VANYLADTLSVIDTSTVAALPGTAGGVGDKTGSRALGGSGGAGAYTNKLVTNTIAVGNGPTGVAVNSQNTVYVTNSQANTLTVIAADGTTNTIAVGNGPTGVATIYPLVFVANTLSDTVSFIGSAPIAVGDGPTGVAYPVGSRVYVANYNSNNVSVINRLTSTVTATIAVGNAPVGIAANQTGTRVYVANSLSGSVSVINTTVNPNTVTTIPAVSSRPYELAVNPAGTRLYVTDATQGENRIAVVNTANNSITYITVGTSQGGIASNPF
jgi:YVTN family beta-propeller protein